MALIVQKYGGKTLSTPEMIRSVAKRVAELRSSGTNVIVIVSAMGDTTNSLQALAFDISKTPNRREFDMLLSTGERISASLLSIALNDLGCPAISFTGSQAGIMTNRSHTDATIKEVRPIRVEAEIEKGNVVVLAGFQGVCPISKEITTLGRGGSDATAVAMADHFKAKRCEILKDVDGIYSADPKKFDDAKKIEKVSLLQLQEMAYWGGQFLHYRSAQMALQKNTTMLIGSAHGKKSGTIASNTDISENNDSSPITVHVLDSVFSSNIDHSASEMQLTELGLRFLIRDEKLKISFYQRVAFESSPANAKKTGLSVINDGLCAITIVFSAKPSATTIDPVASQVKSICSNHAQLTSLTSLTFFIEQKYSKKVEEALHKQCVEFKREQ